MFKGKEKVKGRRFKVREEVEEDGDQEAVYFRLRRACNEEQPQQQLIVDRLPRKRQPTDPNPQQQPQEKQDEISKLFSNLNLQKSVQFFLKRVENIPKAGPPTQSQQIQASQAQKANLLAQKKRATKREQIFDKARGIESNVKIIDLEPEFVQLGDEKVQVENLGVFSNYYYKLAKRNTIKQGPSISLPENSMYLLNKLEFDQQSQKEDRISEQDHDSNRESNPDYDYPDQDYHEGDSEDEGIINKDFYPGQSSDQERNQSDVELDQEEVYRRYLKRCKDQPDSDNDDQYF